MNKLSAVDTQIVVNSVHLAIIIPLVFLSIRRDLIPLMINPKYVVYLVYAILLAGVVSHGYKLVMNVKEKIEQRKMMEEVVSEKPVV